MVRSSEVDLNRYLEFLGNNLAEKCRSGYLLRNFQKLMIPAPASPEIGRSHSPITAENMARRVKLDRIDRRILRDLQDDGRMTNVELASRAGISAPPCLRRVRALEESGFIRGYHAEVNGEALGYKLTVFAFVGLSSQAEADLVAFENMVGEWPEVRECNMLSGETDFVLKVVARDWDSFQRFLTTRLTPAPNVSNVKTAIGLRCRKRLPGVPIDEEVSVDDEDDDV